jgi:DNA-binding MarR family transcriptional regulator
MTSKRGAEPRLTGRLTYLLKRTLLDLDLLHSERLAPIGVTGKELGVLLLLDGRDPESQQEIAARLGVDRTTMVGLIDGLEAKGLVARRADIADRRRNVVELTEDGRTALPQSVRASDEAERMLLAPLTDTESAQLRKLLMRLIEDRSQNSSTRLD